MSPLGDAVIVAGALFQQMGSAAIPIVDARINQHHQYGEIVEEQFWFKVRVTLRGLLIGAGG